MFVWHTIILCSIFSNSELDIVINFGGSLCKSDSVYTETPVSPLCKYWRTKYILVRIGESFFAGNASYLHLFFVEPISTMLTCVAI